MTPGTKDRGNLGEEVAARHLARMGYRIVERNWRCRHGEADIVASQGKTLIFVEVKARSAADFGSPFDAVDARKQRKLVAVARAYLSLKRLADTPVRFDVVGVRLDVEPPSVVILPNAFEAVGWGV